MNHNFKDIRGQKFGKLLVIEMSSEKTYDGKIKWFCKCDCGNTGNFVGKYLRCGDTKSCGCANSIKRGIIPSGKDHPSWKGGHMTPGSIPWANKTIYNLNNNSKTNGYSGLSKSVTPEDIINLWKNFDGKCAICNRPEKEFPKKHAIDHDHKTGLLRGYLCSNCNRSLGGFKDSPEILQKAIEYLQKTTIKQEEYLTV